MDEYPQHTLHFSYTLIVCNRSGSWHSQSPLFQVNIYQYLYPWQPNWSQLSVTSVLSLTQWLGCPLSHVHQSDSATWWQWQPVKAARPSKWSPEPPRLDKTPVFGHKPLCLYRYVFCLLCRTHCCCGSVWSRGLLHAVVLRQWQIHCCSLFMLLLPRKARGPCSLLPGCPVWTLVSFPQPIPPTAGISHLLKWSPGLQVGCHFGHHSPILYQTGIARHTNMSCDRSGGWYELCRVELGITHMLSNQTTDLERCW